MVYTTNIPQAGDLISNSQSQILGNFQFLGDTSTRNGITVGASTGGYYKLPNGLIWQYFSIPSIDGTAGPVSVSLLTPLTTIINIQITIRSGNSSARTAVVDTTAFTTTSFPVRTSNNLTSGCYFSVIGIA